MLLRIVFAILLAAPLLYARAVVLVNLLAAVVGFHGAEMLIIEVNNLSN